MNMTLRQADGHHDKAKKLYRDYLINTAADCGSVANMAAQCGIPVKKVHEALNIGSKYTETRNMAHEVIRKLGK